MRMGKEAVVLGYQVFVHREIRGGHVGAYAHEAMGFEKQKAK